MISRYKASLLCAATLTWVVALLPVADRAAARAQTLDDRDRQDELNWPDPWPTPPPLPGKPRAVPPALPPAYLLTRPTPSPVAVVPSPSPSPEQEAEAGPSPAPTPTPRPDYLKSAEEIALEPIEETQQHARALTTVFQVQPRFVLPFGGDLQGLPPLIGGAVDFNFLPTGMDIFSGKMAVEMSIMFGRGTVAGADISGAPADLPVSMFDAGVALNYYFLAESTFQPFISLGVSYFSINFTSQGHELTTVTTPIHLRAGVDVMLFSNAGITLDVAYLYSPLRLTNFNPFSPGTAVPLDFPAAGPGAPLAGITIGLGGKVAF